MAIIKNRLSASILDLSGDSREGVLEYLAKIEAIDSVDDDAESRIEKLAEFENSYRSTSIKTEFFCVVTRFVNDRPFFSLILIFALLYNIVWGITKLGKIFLMSS
jgi:hypothetical protein